MNFNEIGEFSKALSEAARVIGKTIGEKDFKPMFDYLIGYPLKIAIEAIDRAMRRRDPDDVFQRTTLLTGQEIEQAAKEIMDRELPRGTQGKVSKCEICNGGGWLTTASKEGTLQAYPCKCLYEAAQEALRRRKRPGSVDERLDEERRHTIKAYEYHQEKWGGIK